MYMYTAIYVYTYIYVYTQQAYVLKQSLTARSQMTNWTGFIRALTLMSRHHLAGRGGGLTLHFEGGNWTFERCRLAVTPGALTCVLAIAGEKRKKGKISPVAKQKNAQVASIPAA
jgi:hypothetical protein